MVGSHQIYTDGDRWIEGKGSNPLPSATLTRNRKQTRRETEMKTEENNYILTSIEIDEQFVDNASDSYMTDEEREYWIDGEEGNTDEEIEETYQMTDEEQKGFQDHITEEKCEEPLVENLINIIAGYSTIEEIEQAIAEEKAEEKAERLDAVRRAKETQRLLDRNPWIDIGIDEKAIEKLNNHFNA